MNNYDYEASANQLVERIKELIPTNPEILDMVDAWPLLQVNGFKCDDLQPSLYQATWALAKAKREYLNG